MKQIGYWLLILWLLVACGNAEPTLPTVVPLQTVTAVSTVAREPTATITSTPSATVTIVPTATPFPTSTSIPTVTPLPPLTIAVPTEWETAVSQATSQLQTTRGWQLVSPTTEATFSLQNNGEGKVVWQEPLALVVPFTFDLEAITIEKAQMVLATGDPNIAVFAWSAMVPQQKALRVNGRLPNEPDYPLQNQWSLHSQPSHEAEAEQLALALNSSMAQTGKTAVWLTAVGDIMLDRSLGYALSLGDLAYPFADIVDELTPADITLGNFESALGNLGEPALKSYPFRAPPEAAPALAQAGFDIVSLANNHGMDYGAQALLQGIDLLENEGIATIGAGENDAAARQPHLLTVNGLSIAFLGYVHVPVESRGFDTATWTATETTTGLAWGYPEVIAEDVTAVHSQVDIVIVVLHSGYEYRDDPSPPQIAAAKSAVDAGADLVIGHHAHILQGIEFYKDGVIVYGLGNFAFEIDGPPETAVLHLWLDQNGVRQLNFVPAIIQFGGQPRPATDTEAYAIRQRLYHLIDKLNE